jgi:hypothetical protein
MGQRLNGDDVRGQAKFVPNVFQSAASMNRPFDLSHLNIILATHSKINFQPAIFHLTGAAHNTETTQVLGEMPVNSRPFE